MRFIVEFAVNHKVTVETEGEEKRRRKTKVTKLPSAGGQCFS